MNTLLVGLLLAAGGSSSEPQPTASIVNSRPRAFAPPTVIQSTSELGGARLKWGKTWLMLTEIQFGVDKDWTLIPAYYEGVDSSGEHHVYDGRVQAKKLFNNMDDVRGCFIQQAGQRVWVEEIRFGLTPEGMLTTASLRGTNASGDTFSLDNTAFTPACACVWEAICGPGDCAKPREKCYNDPPCNGCTGVSGD